MENFFIITNKHLNLQSFKYKASKLQKLTQSQLGISALHLQGQGKCYYFDISDSKSLMDEINLDSNDEEEEKLFKEFLRKFKICTSQPNDVQMKKILEETLKESFLKIKDAIEVFGLERTPEKWIEKRKLFEDCLMNIYLEESHAKSLIKEMKDFVKEEDLSECMSAFKNFVNEPNNDDYNKILESKFAHLIDKMSVSTKLNFKQELQKSFEKCLIRIIRCCIQYCWHKQLQNGQ